MQGRVRWKPVQLPMAQTVVNTKQSRLPKGQDETKETTQQLDRVESICLAQSPFNSRYISSYI